MEFADQPSAGRTAYAPGFGWCPTTPLRPIEGDR